jgi:hypothetical protein
MTGLSATFAGSNVVFQLFKERREQRELNGEWIDVATVHVLKCFCMCRRRIKGNPCLLTLDFTSAT